MADMEKLLEFDPHKVMATIEDERSEQERLMEEARENPPWEPTAENVERWAVFRRRMGDMQAFVRLTAITQRLREIEEAAREAGGEEGQDGA